METLHKNGKSSDEKHAKTVDFMRAWAKRKQDKHEQIRKDYDEGKYHDWLLKLSNSN